MKLSRRAKSCLLNAYSRKMPACFIGKEKDVLANRGLVEIQPDENGIERVFITEAGVEWLSAHATTDGDLIRWDALTVIRKHADAVFGYTPAAGTTR